MLTYNNLLYQIKSFFEAHHFVNRVTTGQFFMSQIDKEYPFPHVHIELVGVDFGEQLLGMNFDMKVMDLPRVEDGKELPQQEIHSDTLQIINDFLAEMQRGGLGFFDNYQLQFSASGVEAFYLEHTQSVTGWQMQFTISQYNSYDVCNIPVSNATPTPSGDCEVATIVDSEGNELFTVSSGGEQAIDYYAVISAGAAANTIQLPVTSWAGIANAIGTSTLTEVSELIGADGLTDAQVETNASNLVGGFSERLEDDVKALVCDVAPIPAYVRPMKPASSYEPDDLKDQYDNGVFDRLDSSRVGTVRVLDNNYKLADATPNHFGNTARYTFTDGTNAWNGTSFDTTYPVGGEYIIINHLEHLALYVANLGNTSWSQAIAACEGLSAGGFDWRLGAPNEYESFWPKRDVYHYQSGNPFRRGVVSTFNEFYFWTSRTNENSTTQAYNIQLTATTASTNKTSNSLLSCYAIANYDPA